MPLAGAWPSLLRAAGLLASARFSLPSAGESAAGQAMLRIQAASLDPPDNQSRSGPQTGVLPEQKANLESHIPRLAAATPRRPSIQFGDALRLGSFAHWRVAQARSERIDA